MKLVTRSTWLFVFVVLLGMGPGCVWGQRQPSSPPSVLPVNPLRAGSYLGLGIQEITSDRAKTLNLKEEAGVEITKVTPGSPADKAGLKSGDVILFYNDTKVDGIEQMSRLVRETPVGREVKLDVIRNGAAQIVTARTGQHAANAWVLPDARAFRLPDGVKTIQGMRSPLLGVDAEALDGQLAQYFGVKDGVLVRMVARGSVAEKAGIKAGDVIVKVDDAKVTTPAEISTQLRVLAGKSIPLSVVRDRRELIVMVSVEAVESGSRRSSGRAEPVRIVSSDSGWR